MNVPISITVNGRRHELDIDSRLSLVELVREQLRLTGAHVGCRTGNCGACTLILDSQTVKSCCVLAADVDGSDITTVEGIVGLSGALHPIQAAFVEHQGLQCGFCTPGMLLSTLVLLERNPTPTEDEIRHGIAGNLCRCTGYQNIVKSIQAAAAARAAAPLRG
ncbi:MAG: (2Fe-2S)-binding protein [Candidatus Dormibacteria bacterium]